MKRLTLLPLLALLAAAPASPHDLDAVATRADTLALTLDDAVQRALREGEEIRTANAGVTIANGRVREAMAVAMPQVNGSLTYGRQFASIFQNAAPDTSPLASIFKNSPFGSVHTWTGEVTASQLLWSGGRVGAALSAARAYRKSAWSQREETAADVALRTERAYLEAVYARRVLGIARAGLDQARAHLRQVTLYQKEGARSEYDLIRAQVDAANSEPPVVAARNASELALLELKRLVNLPLEQAVVLATPLAFADGLVPVVEDLVEDVSGRPALAGAEADVEVRKQALRVERAARWPQLIASGTLQQQAFPATERPRLDDFHRSLNAQLKLEFPIFLGTRTFGAVERAGAELRQAQAQRDRVIEEVRLEAARARQEVQRTLADLVARRGTARLAARAHTLADVRYRNGLATQLEVTDARLQSQTAEINEVQALKDYRLALLELERALGRKVPVVRRPLEDVAASFTNQESSR